MKIDIKKIATLANLQIEHTKVFEKQLSEVLSHIEKLNEADTQDILPTSQVTGLENVLRDDVVALSLPQNEALSNAKNISDGQFQVAGVLESA